MLYGTRCPPTGAATLYGTRRPSTTSRCAVRGCRAWELPRSCSRCYAGSALTKSLFQSCSESLETKNRLGLQFFLRLRIVSGVPNRALRRKSAGNWPCGGPFLLCGDGRESVIAKKLQKRLNFCFHDGWIASMGGYRNGRIVTTGQIAQMCGFSLAASRPGLGFPIRRSDSLCLAASRGGWPSRAAAQAVTPRAIDRMERPLGLAALG